MPATTAKGYPYPLTSDPFLPATTDFPALAAAIEAKSAREVAAVLSAASVLDVGVSGQIRAGRELVAADFTTLLGLGTPVGLWDAGSLTNLGSGGNLVNKGTVPLTAKGLAGTANHAALFAGSTGQALYIADTGSSDPFRIKSGSWGAWTRSAKRGSNNQILAKTNSAATLFSYSLSMVGASNVVNAGYSLDGSTIGAINGTTDIMDDRWHFIVATFDGSVIRLYVDGALEASATVSGTLFGSSGPFNIGGYGADGSTAAASPHYGRIAVPFVTPDVLSEDQIRLLMAAKVAHGYAVTPTRSHLAVRRKRKGGPYVVGDFSVTPKVLYNFTAGALTDAGSLGANLTNNNAAVSVAGADGQSGGAFQFNGTTQYLSASATGLPSGTSARAYGAWFRATTIGGSGDILSHNGTNFEALLLAGTGVLASSDGTSSFSGTTNVVDGQWHFAVLVVDNAAADGLKRKLYLDGKLEAASTTLATTTVSGNLNIGRQVLSPTAYFTGWIDNVFATDYAMEEPEILSLFAKGSVALPASEKNPGDHVEAMDASNVYVLHDTLDPQHSVDLRVAA